jgi:hypothetical protein
MTNLRENIQFLPLADGQLIANKFLRTQGESVKDFARERLIKTENGIAPRIFIREITAHHLIKAIHRVAFKTIFYNF